MGGKTKLPYFKGCDIELAGADTPSSYKYDPKHNSIKETQAEWSQSKTKRFYENSAHTNMLKQV